MTNHSLNVNESDRAIAASQAGYWGLVNKAREEADSLEWDGLLMEATLKVRAEADPDLLSDRLMELADLAADYADSVQRQVDEADVEDE